VRLREAVMAAGKPTRAAVTTLATSAEEHAWLSLVPLQQALVADVRQPIVMLGAAVAMVCSSRASTSRRAAAVAAAAPKIATRMASAADARQIVRQLMAESVVLASSEERAISATPRSTR
jgi:hypothetical protein